jgi:hypothetical protein
VIHIYKIVAIVAERIREVTTTTDSTVQSRVKARVLYMYVLSVPLDTESKYSMEYDTHE